MKTLFWIMLGATSLLYLAMVLWSLPQISVSAGGLVPFDMRPTGYSTAEAREFLAALSPEGRAFYLGTQHLLDSIYPGLLGVTLALGLALVFGGWLRWVAIALAAIAAIADYLENVAVAGMLQGDAANVSDSMIEVASRWTMLKSGVSTVVFVLLLVGALRLLWQRRRG